MKNGTQKLVSELQKEVQILKIARQSAEETDAVWCQTGAVYFQ
jgi:hypothetical protein